MTGFDRQTISDTTAKMLLEVQAVHFNAGETVHFYVRLGEPGLYRLPQADFLSARAPRPDGNG